MHKVRSEIIGSVWKVEVAVGQTVAEGDTLVIVESVMPRAEQHPSLPDGPMYGR